MQPCRARNSSELTSCLAVIKFAQSRSTGSNRNFTTLARGEGGCIVALNQHAIRRRAKRPKRLKRETRLGRAEPERGKDGRPQFHSGSDVPIYSTTGDQRLHGFRRKKTDTSQTSPPIIRTVPLLVQPARLFSSPPSSESLPSEPFGACPGPWLGV